jgi:hypothetical protein
MLIAFVGDVHGRVFHALAALATLQAKLGGARQSRADRPAGLALTRPPRYDRV